MAAAAQFADGFVTIEQAEALRQEKSRAEFVAVAGPQYDALVAALVAYKRAALAWTEAKQAVALATTLSISDLVTSAERDAAEILKGATARPVVSLEAQAKLERADGLRLEKNRKR